MNKYLSLFFFLCIAEINYAQAPEIIWQNTLGGDNSDDLRSFIQTADGGFLFGGTSDSGLSGDKTEVSMGINDYWIVKTDASGNIEWDNTIGGSSEDILTCIIQTSDGGFMLGGRSLSDISGDKTTANNGSFDYWIVKTDSSGNVEWDKTIGGSVTDYLSSIIQTADGGYLLGGLSSSGIGGDKNEVNLGIYDYWIVKVNSSGSITWQNTIGGSGFESLCNVLQTADGGYLIGGHSTSGISGDKTEASLGFDDYWIVKLHSSGIVQWDNTIGGTSYEYLSRVIQTADGGFMLGGWSISGISGDKTEAGLGSYDYWIVKTDASGNVLWDNTIGGSGSERLYDIIQTSDGGFLIGGSSLSSISGDKTEDNLGNYDFWAVKTDASGSIDWQKTIGGNDDDWLYSIIQLPDDDFLLGGTSESGISGDKTEALMGYDDYWIVKLGDAIFVCNAPSGLTVSDLTPMSANLLWDDSGADAIGYKLQIINVSSGAIYNFSLGAGMTSRHLGPAILSPGEDYAFRLKAICSDGTKTSWSSTYFFSTPMRLSEFSGNMIIFPNPGNGYFTLQISGLNTTQVQAEIFNLTGAMVYSEMFQTEDGNLTEALSLNHLPEGAYILHMTAGEQVFMEQLIIQH